MIVIAVMVVIMISCYLKNVMVLMIFNITMKYIVIKLIVWNCSIIITDVTIIVILITTIYY